MSKQPLGSRQQAWVGALRSRKFRQGRACLHDHEYNRYCCLGVLCELFYEECGVEKQAYIGNTYYGGCDAYLPPAIQEHLRLVGRPLQGNCVSLAEKLLARKNDSEGLTFSQIADDIEQNAHLYFTEPV